MVIYEPTVSLMYGQLVAVDVITRQLILNSKSNPITQKLENIQ